MEYINIITKSEQLPTTIIVNEESVPITWESHGELLRGMGWRIKPELPAVESGYERSTVSWIEGDGTTAQAIYQDTLIQDRLDREAADLALREELAIEELLPKVNILTQETSIPTCVDGWQNVKWSNQRELLISKGWRIQSDKPTLAEGYTRTSIIAIEGNGKVCGWSCVDRPTATIQAEEAQAKLATLPVEKMALFKITMERNFGAGACTNRAIDANAVEAYFIGKQANQTITTQELADASVLERLFRELSEWNGTGETWTLPYEVLQ